MLGALIFCCLAIVWAGCPTNYSEVPENLVMWPFTGDASPTTSPWLTREDNVQTLSDCTDQCYMLPNCIAVEYHILQKKCWFLQPEWISPTFDPNVDHPMYAWGPQQTNVVGCVADPCLDNCYAVFWGNDLSCTCP